jgi:hypothetical protein
LKQAAADIEHQLKDGKNLVTTEQLVILEAELTAALSQLTEELEAHITTSQKPPEPVSQMEPLDAESSLELLEKLEPMLETGSPECLELIESLRSIPGSESVLVTRLINQIEELDFGPALVALAELKKSTKSKGMVG